MLTDYITATMNEAHYEVMEDGRFFGSIPSCKGCWGEGAQLEECRQDLCDAVESWMLHRIRRGMELPIMAGIDLNVPVTQNEYAEAN